MGNLAGKISCVTSLLWLPTRCAFAAITVDANIDEDEWAQAHVYSDFRTTQPLLLNEPPLATRARVLATPEGVAVAVECTQPEELRVRRRSRRDAPVMDGDSVSVVVDFDGSGSTAYEFTVALSGSVRDGVILQQNRTQYAWDGLWNSAVRETPGGWNTEILLPWSIAPLGAVRNGHRTIGFYVGRELKARAQRFAYPAVPLLSPSFVADLQAVDVPALGATLLTATPYGAIGRDLLTESTRARAGLDVTWRPTADQQFTATLNPDFGQIESDDLIVNFTAVEIFVPDKRPFFTENEQLFDIRTTQQDRLINTKRIGAAPDAGTEGATDVLGAAKYFRSGPGWELGAFVATEDDSIVADGRTFAAIRSRWKMGSGNLGYLGTFTARPTVGRQVSVHSADADWSPGSGWRISGQLITTRPSQHVQNGLSDRAGYGALGKLEYAGTAPLTQTMYLAWYDKWYDTNDLGFQERNSLRELWSQTRWYYRREYPVDSRLLETQWYFTLRARTNELGERLPSSLQISPFWKYRDGSSLLAYVQPVTAGIDDRISRGNGSFLVPPQHEARLSFLSDPSRPLQYFWYLKTFREGLKRYGWEAQVQPSWWLSETLRLVLSVTYRDSPDWLIWRADEQRMIQHERKLLQTMVSAEWFRTARSELTLKVQWSGLQVRGISAYDIDTTRHLVPSVAEASDFARSELAMQLRFRYQLQPLSDLYIAYTFGGLVQPSDESNFGRLWDAALGSPDAHQLMIKVTYRL
jgi:hypothetical protein